MKKYAIHYDIEEMVILGSALKFMLEDTQKIVVLSEKKQEYFAKDYYQSKAQIIQKMITKAEMAEAA